MVLLFRLRCLAWMRILLILCPLLTLSRGNSPRITVAWRAALGFGCWLVGFPVAVSLRVVVCTSCVVVFVLVLKVHIIVLRNLFSPHVTARTA